MKTLMEILGQFKVTVRDKSGLILAQHDFPNTVMTEGVNHMYEALFRNAAQNATWYIGLINATPTPAIVIGDTLASHAGWNEYTNYTGNRPAWDEAAAASRAINTSTNSTFTISGATGTETIYGAFLCNVATGTTGVLRSAGAFAASLSVVNGNTVDVAYSSSVS